ncbi:MAG TPA: hypothetical protein VJV79_37450 [Polyangiaceae bacterium]|nr:hypothetical protein [Polyangiaceae bacterium]
MVPRILLVVGASLIASGCWLFLSDSPHTESKRTASLPAVQPASVRELPSNTAILLAGRLLAREALGPQGFVVYEKERYLRTETEGASKGKQQWLAISVPRSLIGVELNGAQVPVCNRDYSIQSPPQRWQSEVLPTSRDLFTSTIRLRGFKSGDELTVDGRVVGSPSIGTQCIEAKSIFGGGPRAYQESVRHGIIVFKVVGTIFAVLGGVMLGIGWWLWRRLSAKRGRVSGSL